MSIQFKDIQLPDFGYELVRQIKALDGRIDFLTQWDKEIKQHVEKYDRKFNDTEFVDSAGQAVRLKVTRTKPSQTRRIQYAEIEKRNRALFQQAVIKTPPPFPRTPYFVSHTHRVRSLEWSSLSKVGFEAEQRSFPSRGDWKKASGSVLASGLRTLRLRRKGYATDMEELRLKFAEMAEECEWESGICGQHDGRVQLREAAAKYALKPTINRETFLRDHSAYVSFGTRAGGTTVAFYGINGEELI